MSDISKINIDKKEYFFKDAEGRVRAEEAATEAENAAKEYTDAQVKALKGAVSADFNTLEKIEDKIEELDSSVDERFVNLNESLNTSLEKIEDEIEELASSVDERFVNLNESLDTSFDGIDEQIGSTNAKVSQVETTANNALALAQSKNLNKVFETTSAMYTWLANAANKSQLQVGSTLYIKEADVPDWWVTEVLNAPNADGRYYNIAPLEAEGAGGAAGPIEEFEGELTVDGWIGNLAPYTQTVVIDELSDYNNCAITLSSSATEEQMYAAALAEISDISYNENNNTITFVANGEKPTIVIPFIVCAGQSMNVVEMPNYLGQEIPTNHASAITTYGAGSVANYGHVKVSDSYKTSDGAASAGVAASSKAMADAYAEINSNLKWKYWNNAFGTNTITLPEKYEELILEVERGESNVRYPIHVTHAQLIWTVNNPGTELCFKAGQCTTSTNYESVSVIATTTYARIYTVYDSGRDITDSSELRIYYR